MTHTHHTWIALIASCLMHILLFGVAARHVQATPLSRQETISAPLVFNFAPEPIAEEKKHEEEPERMKRLVETSTSTTKEIAETDLISDNNSKAQDESEMEGDPTRPSVEDPDDFDQLATPEVSTVLETPMAQAKPPTEATEPVKPQPKPEQPEESASVTSPPIDPAPMKENEASPKESTEKSESNKVNAGESDQPKQALPERMQIAAATGETQPEAEPAPKVAAQNMHITKGRAGGGASESGVLNFEAKSDEISEYMLEVRRRVELEWRTALKLQYQGVKRAEAQIECSIRPDGTLAYVRIKKAGDSMPYAIVCRAAVEQAAPFPKLPFNVPDVYRTENIEITWRFTFM